MRHLQTESTFRRRKECENQDYTHTHVSSWKSKSFYPQLRLYACSDSIQAYIYIASSMVFSQCFVDSSMVSFHAF